ncbi:hypothetical protein [Nitrospirillum amazonense]|uniref:hypothetical protein n=1 Tax=Nitrospirillum amazonense TaxID=28077 RepID=UPI002412E69B|nr:hypothetical protein [Nitrospirillum amazonense]MDG3442459.1 hypothetical protein [Nitrospirillum amazonense]
MSASFQRDWVESRRLFLLRYLVEVGDSCLESLLLRAGLTAFRRDGEEQLKGDITHLVKQLCIETEAINTADGASALRMLTITKRGREAAEGRGEPVPGVQHSRWDR